MSSRQPLPVQTIESTATLRQAAQRLDEHGVGALVVTDPQGQALAIVTDRDLTVRAVALGYPQDSTAVDKVMSAPLFSADAGAAPEELAAQMRKLGVRRIPVLDKGVPVELLALDDVLLHLADRFQDLASAVQAMAQESSDGFLAHLEHSFEGLRQRAAGAAWKAEASFFDELDRACKRLRSMVRD